ncbi:hypothetical protein VPHD479_0222 [Vibrio phage D479]
MSLRDITAKLAKTGFNTEVFGYDVAVCHDAQYQATISVAKEDTAIILGFAKGSDVKSLKADIMSIIENQDYTPKGVVRMAKKAGISTGKIEDIVSVKPVAKVTTTAKKRAPRAASKPIVTPKGEFESIHACAKEIGSYYSVIKNRVESTKEAYAEWKWA